MTTLLFITGSLLINVLLWLVIAGVIFFVINWFIGYVGIPEPFNKVIKVVVGLIALIIVINALLSLVGYNFIH